MQLLISINILLISLEVFILQPNNFLLSEAVSLAPGWTHSVLLEVPRVNDSRLAPRPLSLGLGADNSSLSRIPATLVVVRGHSTPQDNSNRIGSPKYKNLKIRRERREVRTLLQVYLRY